MSKVEVAVDPTRPLFIGRLADEVSELADETNDGILRAASNRLREMADAGPSQTLTVKVEATDDPDAIAKQVAQMLKDYKKSGGRTNASN